MLEDFKNQIDYFIRSKTKFSRKNYKGEIGNQESLYVFNLLEKYLFPDFCSDLRILDIGSKNWAYVKGEYDFFKKYCNNLYLDGVELDAYRLYSNFYSRYEVAKFYTKNLKNTKYYAKNLLDIQGKYDYIIWLLPFVTQYPLMKWGLPKKYFMPEKLLEHAYNLLNRQMVVINQGEVEAEIQQKMLDSAGIKYKSLGKIEDSNLIFKISRYGFLVSK